MRDAGCIQCTTLISYGRGSGIKPRFGAPPSCVRSCSPHLHPFTYNVGKTVPQTNPQITIFIGGGGLPFPNARFMTLF
jgi:hypothetical protein